MSETPTSERKRERKKIKETASSSNNANDDLDDPLKLSRPMLDALISLPETTNTLETANIPSTITAALIAASKPSTTTTTTTNTTTTTTTSTSSSEEEVVQTDNAPTPQTKQQWWTELRPLIRQIYREATPHTIEAFAASFDTAYNLVRHLSDHDPGLLFQRLEREAQDWAEALRASITSTASVEPEDLIDVTVCHLEDLVAANEIFESVLVHFQTVYLGQWHITFSDVNFGVVNEVVLKDPVVFAMLDRAKVNKAKAFNVCEKTVKDSAARWRRVRDQVTKHSVDLAKEVRIREECSKLHLCLHEFFTVLRTQVHQTCSFDYEFCSTTELPSYKTATTEAEVAILAEKRAHCCPQCCPLIFTYWNEPGPRDTLNAFQATRRKLRVRIREYHIAIKMRMPVVVPESNSAREFYIEQDERPVDALVSFVTAGDASKKKKKEKQSQQQTNTNAAAAITKRNNSSSSSSSNNNNSNNNNQLQTQKEIQKQQQLKALQMLEQQQKKKKKSKSKKQRKRANSKPNEQKDQQKVQQQQQQQQQQQISSLEEKLKSLPQSYPRYNDVDNEDFDDEEKNNEGNEYEEGEGEGVCVGGDDLLLFEEFDRQMKLENESFSDPELLEQQDKEVEEFRRFLESHSKRAPIEKTKCIPSVVATTTTTTTTTTTSSSLRSSNSSIISSSSSSP